MTDYLRYKGAAATAPVNVVSPSFMGASVVGATLFGSQGQASGTPTPSSTVQWLMDDTLVSGATDINYVVQSGDIGKVPKLRRIDTNTAGSINTDSPGGTIIVAASGGTTVNASTYGMKTSQTTGSIDVGSFTLNVADASGFSQGDQIIVENTTLPGTKGVGGSWPALIYANKAAMDADLSQPNNTYACFAGDGITAPYGSLHRFNASTGTWNIYNNTEWKEYYWDRAQPFSLVAKILSKSTNTLTLNLPAQISVTNANVYFDNSPIIKPLCSGATKLSNQTLQFDAGTYCFSENILFDQVAFVTIQGAGRDATTLKSPLCTPSMGIKWTSCTSCNVRDLHLLGNCADSGYGTGITPSQSQTTLSRSTTTGIWYYACNGSLHEVTDCKMTNPWTGAVSSSYTWNVKAYRCDVYSAGHRCYIQWMFQFADQSNCYAEDCHVYADYLTGGFETFRSNNTTFVRCGGVNCAFSSNSSGTWLYDSPFATITAGAQKTPPGNFGTTGFFSSKGEIYNFNNNIQPPASTIDQGGELRNATLIIEGEINSTDHAVPNPITIGPQCSNVRITGTYGRDTVSPKGYFQMPTVTDSYDSRRGIKSDSAVGSMIDGIRIVGGRPESWGWIIDLSNPTAQGTVKNCVVDSVAKIDAATKSNNISGTDYDAKGAAFGDYLTAVS